MQWLCCDELMSVSEPVLLLTLHIYFEFWAQQACYESGHRVAGSVTATVEKSSVAVNPSL